MKSLMDIFIVLSLSLSWGTLVIAQPQDQTPADRTSAEQTPDIISQAMADGTQGGRIIALHRAAVVTMRKTCDDYRRIKSLELSVTLNIPFREAYGNINDVMPILDPIDFDLLRQPVQLPKQIQPHKDEIAKVQQQVEMMIELTEKLLKEIEQAKVVIEQHLENQQEIKLEDIVQQEQFDPQKQPEEQAQQQKDQKKQAQEQAETQQQQASTEQESQDQQEEQNAKDQSLKDLVELAKVDEHRHKDVSQAMRQVMAHQQINPQTPPPTLNSQQREELKTQAKNISDTDRKKLQSVTQHRKHPENGTLGRMVTDTGDPTEWLFVDTWYNIGPFPNPSRVNLNRKFPPESVVDLDAVYVGKDGRQIRWQFQQARKLQVTPIDAEEYGIWYAYTELYFQKDMDLWIAVGSDDKANIWVNGLPVWISGDQLKNWSPNEGYRKVAFKAGRNRILYRVENGWHGIQYSLAVRVAE
ncbi:MAG: hypothetical protein CMJ19_16295 [Phycisphaeraceae bacterium]|nr:hypothetical protein [Phycisphaeraceae bacterium]